MLKAANTAVLKRPSTIGGMELGTTLPPQKALQMRQGMLPTSWSANPGQDNPPSQQRASIHDVRRGSRTDTTPSQSRGASINTSNGDRVDPNVLRAAVTTSTDEFSVFEDQLLAEINLLRQNPRKYAVLFEAEATIGYPYVCPDDIFFDSEERVTEQFVVKPQAKPAAPEKAAKGHRSDKERGAADDTTEEGSPPLHLGNDKKGKDHSRPHSARSSANASSEKDVVMTAIQMLEQEKENRPKPPGTVRDFGMYELNVEQLRTFFLRHQKHRMLLEKAVRDLIHQWQVADQAQHDAWAAEDAQASKKIKRGGRKKSVSNFAFDDLSRQRSTLSDQLSHRFLEKLKSLMYSLCRSRDTCKRAMDGANLMLDCIRALKEAKPVPALRSSRGLKLAARDTGQFFHRDADEIERVFRVHEMAIENVCPSRLPPVDPESAVVAQENKAIFGVEDPSMPNFEARNAAEAVRYFETLFAPNTGMNCSSAEGPMDALPLYGQMAAGPANSLKAYINALAEVTQHTCDEYGYVSGEVRGVQLYGAGTARSLVMRALLGVSIPIFGFRELHPVMARSNSPPRHNEREPDGWRNQKNRTRQPYEARGGSPGSRTGSSRRTHTSDHRSTSAVERRPGSIAFESSIFNVASNGDDRDDEHEQGSGNLFFDGTIQSDQGSGLGGTRTLHGSSTSMKTTTGLMFGGTFNPTSAAAAKFITAEAAAENTSAGKRSALAAQRLGPLLWRDAHLLGCGWQRVICEKPVPPYDDREIDPIPQATNHDVVVSTTLVVASGYEELDIIEQHKHMSLAEVRRIVRFEEENEMAALANEDTMSTAAEFNSTITGGACNPDRPAVVDLHSSLEVTLIYPKKHPIRVEENMETAWLALHANPANVRLVATLSGAQEARPQSPVLNAAELLVQPSSRDSEVILVLLNVAAAKTKANDGKVLIHLFECDKSGSGESGFEHIGFVRLTLPNTAADRSCTSPGGGFPGNSPLSGAGLRGTDNLHGMRSARSAKSSQRSYAATSGVTSTRSATSGQALQTHTELMTVAPADLFLLVQDLRLSPHPPLSTLHLPSNASGDVVLLPSIPQYHRNHLRASPERARKRPGARGTNRMTSAAAALYGSSGWPLCTCEFFDRCATLLGPLTGCLTTTSETCRVSIYIPHCPSFLKIQIESIVAMERELRAKEMEEEAQDANVDSETDSLMEDTVYRQEVLGEAPPKPRTPNPPPPPEPVVAAGKGKKADRAVPAAGARGAKGGGKGAADAAPSGAHDKRNSIQNLDESTLADLLMLPPTSAHRYDPSVKMPLRRLHVLSDRLMQEAVVCRTKFAHAEAALAGKMADMASEMEKHKGKEVLRLKTELEELSGGLESMHEKVVQVEEISMRARQEIMSRERNRVVRRARLQQLELELEQLRSRADRQYPLQVKLWFTGGSSSLPLSTERGEEAPYLPPIGTPASVSASSAGNPPAQPAQPFDSTMTPSEVQSPYVQPGYLESQGMSRSRVASHAPPHDSHVVVLEPRDEHYTLYEADFVVPEAFEGQAVLLINDQEASLEPKSSSRRGSATHDAVEVLFFAVERVE
eukprot:gene1944-1182_t